MRCLVPLVFTDRARRFAVCKSVSDPRRETVSADSISEVAPMRTIHTRLQIRLEEVDAETSAHEEYKERKLRAKARQ